jgi:hypothetical protein
MVAPVDVKVDGVNEANKDLDTTTKPREAPVKPRLDPAALSSINESLAELTRPRTVTITPIFAGPGGGGGGATGPAGRRVRSPGDPYTRRTARRRDDAGLAPRRTELAPTSSTVKVFLDGAEIADSARRRARSRRVDRITEAEAVTDGRRDRTDPEASRVLQRRRRHRANAGDPCDVMRRLFRYSGDDDTGTPRYSMPLPTAGSTGRRSPIRSMASPGVGRALHFRDHDAPPAVQYFVVRRLGRSDRLGFRRRRLSSRAGPSARSLT